MIAFVAGLMIGGFVATIILCCLQVNRVREYEVDASRPAQKPN